MSPLLLSLVAVFGLMTALWLASLRLRDASIIDIFWGPGFVLAAWILALGEPDGAFPRRWLVPSLVSGWGLRLAWHIARRSRGKGEDPRYAAMRRHWGRRFPWVSLLTVFWLQAAILWVVALPLWQAVRSPVPAGLTAWDLAGLLVFAVGLVFEAVGDAQLARFKADPANRGRLLTTGLWRYTRHPNYFGDAAVWWGLSLFALATPGSWWVLVSPALMTFLLMKVSGVALLEKGLSASKPGYADYARRTSAFFPWPPDSPGPAPGEGGSSSR